MSEVFRKFSATVSRYAGSYYAFLLAFGVVFAWGITGPLFNFSDTWQLVINTGTTIVTFLMVFLIQNTQNRDAHAIHAKLDELLYRIKDADNHLIEAEDLSDKELDELKQHYVKLAESVGAQPNGHSRRPASKSGATRSSGRKPAAGSQSKTTTSEPRRPRIR